MHSTTCITAIGISIVDTGSARGVDVELEHSFLGWLTITVIETDARGQPEWCAYYGGAGVEHACGMSWPELAARVEVRLPGIPRDESLRLAREYYADAAESAVSAAYAFDSW